MGSSAGVYANSSIGSLTNTGTISGVQDGIYSRSGITTLVNKGNIAATYTAVKTFGAIGTLSNSGTISSSGSGVYAGSGIGTLTNSGLIQSASSIAIYSDDQNGTLTNTGTISGGSEGVVAYGLQSGNNSGSIIGVEGAAINIGGYIAAFTNSGQVISDSRTGIYARGGIGELTNSGTISGASGIDTSEIFGTLTNSGLIEGNAYYGIYSYSGIATLSNTGTISGGSTGIYSYGASGTLTNSGLIEGSHAIAAHDGAGIVNTATGTLLSLQNGAVLLTGVSTVDNAGLIDGNGGDAIDFNSGGSNLILRPTSTIIGNVVNESAGTATLTLAGGHLGTLEGLGSQYVGFTDVVENTGAKWLLSGSNTLDASTALDVNGTLKIGGTLIDAGTATVSGLLQTAHSGILQVAGVTLAGGALRGSANGTVDVGTGDGTAVAGSITVEAGASVTGMGRIVGVPIVNDGTITATGGTLTFATAMSGTGNLEIGTGATVVVISNIASAVDFTAGTGEALQLAAGAAVTGTISGFGDGDTISLRVSASSFTFVGNTLTLENGAGDKVLATLQLAGSYSAANFDLTKEANGITQISYIDTSVTASATKAETHAYVQPIAWHAETLSLHQHN